MTADRPRAFNSTLPVRSVRLAARSSLSRGASLTRHSGLPASGLRANLSVIDGREGAEVVVLEAKRRRSRPETGFSRSVKLAVRKRAGGGDPDEARCEATGVWLGRHGGEIQHRRARGMGGTSDPVTDSIVNAVLLSKDAHRLAESRDEGMNTEGFWLRNGEDPALTPILLHSEHGSGMTVRLLADGTYGSEPPDGAA